MAKHITSNFIGTLDISNLPFFGYGLRCPKHCSAFLPRPGRLNVTKSTRPKEPTPSANQKRSGAPVTQSARVAVSQPALKVQANANLDLALRGQGVAGCSWDGEWARRRVVSYCRVLEGKAGCSH